MNADILIEKIENIRKEKGSCIAAIDGRCASGKSTLAKEIGERTGWNVVHMDDFFLRPEQRSKERYETPGENVDHERFLEEVLLPLSEGRDADFHPFDCNVMQISDKVIHVSAKDVLIVEGSYSHHPELRPYYDLRIFLTIGEEEQLERIRKRNPERIGLFEAKWIPLEEMYFRAYDVMAHADIVVDTSENEGN